MNILTGVKEIINASVTGAGSVVKFNNMPDTPHAVVLVRNTGGVEPDANATAEIQELTFQIIVRGTGYVAVENIATSLRELLHLHNGTHGGIDFMMIRIFSEFQPITNELGNYEFSGNFRAKVRNA